MRILRTEARYRLGIALLGSLALSGCGILHPSFSPASSSEATTSNPAITNTGVAQSLQRQIRERNKRIAELESRLDDLKVIDQDMEKLRKFSRPPATLTPAD